MNTMHVEHKVHEVKKHLKSNWAEDVILAIIFVALMCLVLSSSAIYG